MQRGAANLLPGLGSAVGKIFPEHLSGLLGLPVGDIFYVDSVNGAANNNGKQSDQAVLTLDAAVGLCQADHGDVIVLMPAHAETITSTNTTLDVAGITIIGLGNGLKRPVLTFGAAAATITVSADNIKVFNIHHVGNFDNVAAAYTIGAAKYFHLENNSFLDNSASLHFLSIVVTGATNNAADGLTIVNNSWHGLALAPAAFISILGNLSFLTITDNFVNMASTDDEGSFLTISSKVLLSAQILRNRHIVVGATGATVGIFLTGSSTTNTGLVAHNLVASLDTTTELIATAGTGLAFFENYYTGTADASGKLWPAVDGA